MGRLLHSFSRKTLWMVGIFFVLANQLPAHVEMDFPNGGEVFTEGKTVVVEWHVVIQHSLQNWDLWNSTIGYGNVHHPSPTKCTTDQCFHSGGDPVRYRGR